VKVAKNKLAPPMQTTEFDVMFGRGICQAGEILDLGIAHGLVEKSGAWISFEGERVGQGREKARQALRDNRELFGRLREVVLAHSQPSVSFAPTEAELEAA
jgi:recombination protein RecA